MEIKTVFNYYLEEILDYLHIPKWMASYNLLLRFFRFCLLT